MAEANIYEHYGMCDASAAVALSQELFLVANDEDNIFRVYHAQRSGEAIQEIDVSPWLQLTGKHEEVDWEAATRIHDVIYWISSHGTNRKGEPRPNRRRILATRVSLHNEQVQLECVGQVYTQLVDALTQAPQLARFDFATAATIAPKAPGGLCIEGLCATSSGSLLLGFRNPLPQGKAILLPLGNPQAIPHGQRAQLGEPILLDLGGLGIRSLEYVESRKRYWIVAGAFDNADKFRLYEWSGNAQEAPVRFYIENLHGLRPEAIVSYPQETEQIQILSDDGSRSLQGICCKETPRKSRYFRSMWIDF